VISPSTITGLILAGGRGSRMGGVDKGLQTLRGQPLIAHVAERLRPQVARVIISANRHTGDYARYADAVISDSTPDFAGPLAGILEGLRTIERDTTSDSALLVAPCDSPFVPADLAVRLAQALNVTHGKIAYALTREAAQHAADGGDRPNAAGTPSAARHHFVFALLRAGLAADLATHLEDGERRVRAWYARHMPVQVAFDDERAFYNVNSLQELYELERAPY
jgi:molybdopterin-guanine dinucleotide biosynthesis protein A